MAMQRGDGDNALMTVTLYCLITVKPLTLFVDINSDDIPSDWYSNNKKAKRTLRSLSVSMPQKEDVNQLEHISSQSLLHFDNMEAVFVPSPLCTTYSPVVYKGKQSEYSNCQKSA
jgi:hypothetical protein